MSNDLANNLDRKLDDILFQFSKGNTVEGLRSGSYWMGFEQVKEWKSKFGYQFHIYSNDHLIDKKPHFHILKTSEKIDCRFFFDGELVDCKGENEIGKKVVKALKYMLESPNNVGTITALWNKKNPTLKVS